MLVRNESWILFGLGHVLEKAKVILAQTLFYFSISLYTQRSGYGNLVLSCLVGGCGGNTVNGL